MHTNDQKVVHEYFLQAFALQELLAAVNHRSSDVLVWVFLNVLTLLPAFKTGVVQTLLINCSDRVNEFTC